MHFNTDIEIPSEGSDSDSTKSSSAPSTPQNAASAGKFIDTYI